MPTPSGDVEKVAKEVEGLLGSELSSHWSSIARSVLGEGMVSGVCVWDWMERNWRRRLAISLWAKPAVARRSKPRGAGVVVVGVESSWMGIGCENLCLSVGFARLASAASSSLVSVRSPMEQWM